MKKISLLILLLLAFISTASAQSQSEKYDLEKIVQFEPHLFEIDGSSYLAIHFNNEKDWHTYFINPGDAGLPIELDFKIENKKKELDLLAHPTPKKFIEPGNIITYGYDYHYTFFYKLNEKDLLSLQRNTLEIEGKWLMCKDICIPGKGTGSIKIENGKAVSSKNPFKIQREMLQANFSNLPLIGELPNDIQIYAEKQSGQENIWLMYSFPEKYLNFSVEENSFLIPFLSDEFQFMHEELRSDNNGTIYGRLPLEWKGQYKDPIVELPSTGVFTPEINLDFLIPSNETNKRNKVSYQLSSFSVTSNKTAMEFFESLTPVNKNENKESKNLNEGLLLYLLYAFIGGLILNFMPCVLPIISLKLFSLIKQTEKNNRDVLKHNLSYTLGILSSFTVLALTIVGLKLAGVDIGWGFHLQSPSFVSIMIIILFIFSLNLFGLFEFKTPGGTFLGNVKLEKGFTGDFMSGVLATILSTPCSAPFLGTALIFAFTSSPVMIILTLNFVGLGLAFPFLMTGVFPTSLRLFPKPGAWMENLKKFLGLSMLLTMVWMYDVYLGLIDDTYLALILNLVLVMSFFGLFFHKKMGKSVFFKIVFFVIPFLIFLALITQDHSVPSANTQSQQINTNNGLTWHPWSPAKMKELRDQNKLVFMDFTAKWCFTCKVNKKIVLSSDEFTSLVKENNITLLVADWTRRDDVIGNFLKQHKLVGVPAYFIQKPDGTLVGLGETISVEKIRNNL